MLMMIWVCIILLMIAVVFLIWLHFRNQNDQLADIAKIQHLEDNVQHLEEHLMRSLEIMQDIAKRVHTQQETIEQSNAKLQQVELQNAELVGLLTKVVKNEN